MVDGYKKQNLIILIAGLFLIVMGAFLIFDDFVLHWIVYVGPTVGVPFVDNVLLEHWLYGVVMAILGIALLFISFVSR